MYIAYHMVYMESISPTCRQLSRSIDGPKAELKKPTIFSSITNMRVSSEQLLHSSYSVEHITSPVQFRPAVEIAFITSRSKQSKGAINDLPGIKHILH